jgi:hypothetical protein
MGQSLFKLTCLEDFDELKRNLSPDEDLGLGVSAANSGEYLNNRKCCYQHATQKQETVLPKLASIMAE